MSVEDVLKKLAAAETDEQRLAIEKEAIEQTDNGVHADDPPQPEAK